MKNKQIVFWNLATFAVIHLILEVALTSGTGIRTNPAYPVVMQYIISYWIIKSKIDKKDKSDLIKYTWLVSISVFAVRVILGLIVFGLLQQ